MPTDANRRVTLLGNRSILHQITGSSHAGIIENGASPELAGTRTEQFSRGSNIRSAKPCRTVRIFNSKTLISQTQSAGNSESNPAHFTWGLEEDYAPRWGNQAAPMAIQDQFLVRRRAGRSNEQTVWHWKFCVPLWECSKLLLFMTPPEQATREGQAAETSGDPRKLPAR